jgi:polyphosphate kinase
MSKTKSKKKKKPALKPSLTPHYYFNRELSWLEFNSRVLFQATDERWPLLERMRYLSIYTTNLDEFIMKRVGGIKRYLESEYIFISADGLQVKEQLEKVREKVLIDNEILEKTYIDILNELKKENVHLLKWDNLTKDEVEYCNNYFQDNYFPILTPLSVDPGKHFPFISNLSYSLGLFLKSPFEVDEKIFSRVKIPDVAQEWIRLPGNEVRFVNSIEIIKNNLKHLYRGMEIIDVMAFRVTRNADWDHDDEDTEDLLTMVEESIIERRLQEPIRLEILKDSNIEMTTYLKKELGLTSLDVYYYDNNLEYNSLNSICNLDIPHLRFKDWHPITMPWCQRGNIFDSIGEKDRLVHHPYENFSSSVERFITQAAKDENVLSIKMTLYRTGDNSPIIKSLIEAAENGKQVVCLIELKARFDEKTNIYWARKMEQAGVHVVYGVVGLKTHSKISLVVRKERKGNLKTYCHIATGNYNAKTARLYTDLGLLTSNPKITREVGEIFNYLTGTSLKSDYKHLLISPINAKSKFLKKISDQIKLKKDGKHAYIFAKMNSLEDITITNALYEASQAGVKIDLIVRGFCTLKPQVKGLSDNINVYSIIGRFLEHSRIFFFSNGEEGKGDYFIGSADWMHRNLHGRVEVLTPLYDETIQKMIQDYIDIIFQDKRTLWVLGNDGKYKLKKSTQTKGTQEMMMDYVTELYRSTDL